MSKSVELSIWLGIAGLAFLCAQLLLWRTRHTLNQSRPDRLIEASTVPAARLAPPVPTESASSVLAS